MRAAALWVALLTTAGCAASSNNAPPGPHPIPSPWQPKPFMRGRLPQQDTGEVVVRARDGLGPDEAALMAIDQHPRLRAVRAARGIARTALIGAGVLPNPRIDGNLDFPVGGEEATVLGYGVGVSWNITPWLSSGARTSAAKAHLTSIDLEVAWQEWQVAQGARLRAVRAVYLARQVAVATELEQAWTRRLHALRAARLKGATTELEVTHAERSKADARVNALKLSQRLVHERVGLNQAIGIDPAAEVRLDLAYHPENTFGSRRELLKGLPQRRLDLLALQHAHRFHDRATQAAIVAQFPAVEIGFQASREVDDVGAAGVALSFEIPLLDRNQATIAAERARRIQVEAEYDARLHEARADVVRATAELPLVRAQLAAATEASRAAEELARQAREAATHGAVDPLLGAEILERAYTARLRVLRIEQSLAELGVALTLASGTHVGAAAAEDDEPPAP